MRIQRVQAKRKALDLSQDGKCCGLMTRKASYAFRQSWMSVYEKCFFDFPDPHDFERVSPRVKRKRKRRAKRELMLMRSLMRMSDAESEWVRAMSQGMDFYEQLMRITPQDLGELNNVNRP